MADGGRFEDFVGREKAVFGYEWGEGGNLRDLLILLSALIIDTSLRNVSSDYLAVTLLMEYRYLIYGSFIPSKTRPKYRTYRLSQQ